MRFNRYDRTGKVKCAGPCLATHTYLNKYGVCAHCWGEYDYATRKRIAGGEMPPEPTPIIEKHEITNTIIRPWPRGWMVWAASAVTSAALWFAFRWLGW